MRRQQPMDMGMVITITTRIETSGNLYFFLNLWMRQVYTLYYMVNPQDRLYILMLEFFPESIVVINMYQ